jgi:hypothetical protein
MKSLDRFVTHLVPCPYRPEGVEEAHILEQIRVQPETGCCGEHCDDEQNQSYNGHGEKQSYQSKHTHADVPDTLSQYEGPQRKQNNGNHQQQCSTCIQLLLPLRPFVQPNVVVVIIRFLVLLDLNVPLPLDVLLLSMIMAFVSRCIAVDLGYTKREQREREQLESVLGGGAVVDFG